MKNEYTKTKNMPRIFHTVAAWYERYERSIASVSLIGGFIFDFLFLTHIDRPFENVVILLHLFAAAGGILFLNALENKTIKTKLSETASLRLHFWSIIVIQFMFGGLLSKYLVFYFRSGSLATSWPFLLILFVAFFLNERMRRHYERLDFQISFLFLSTYAFAIYYLPVLAGRIGNDIFILAGLISLAATAIFIVLLVVITRERFARGRTMLYVSVGGLFVLINALYFTNLIPPIPVSLKTAGMYYSVKRTANADYAVTRKPSSLADYFRLYEPIDIANDQPIYAFTSVFSPASFRMNLIHEWQRYDETKGKWVTASIVPLPTAGGRDGGFRTYSLKTSHSAGKWRVNVKTAEGKTLGRIRFMVNITDAIPSLETQIVT